MTQESSPPSLLRDREVPKPVGNGRTLVPGHVRPCRCRQLADDGADPFGDIGVAHPDRLCAADGGLLRHRGCTGRHAGPARDDDRIARCSAWSPPAGSRFWPSYELLTPWTILGLIFAVGSGVAIFTPSWQASLGDIVPRDRWSRRCRCTIWAPMRCAPSGPRLAAC